MDWIEFMIRFSVAYAALFLMWKITGSKKTDPVFDRYFMLLSPFIAGILPFIRIHLQSPESTLVNFHEIPDIQNLMSYLSVHQGNEEASTDKTLLFVRTGKWIYTFIGLLLLFRSIHSIYLKYKLIHKYGAIKKEKFKIVDVNQKILPFSFMHYIFLNSSAYDPVSQNTILEHEKAHILQRHYLDLMIFEVLKIFLWFHPVYWLTRRILLESHEYLADKRVLKMGVNKTEYMHLILSHMNFYSLSGVGNTFSKKITLKRLYMMDSKQKSQIVKRIIFSLSGAVLFALIMGFEFSHNPNITETEGISLKSANINPPFLAPLDLEKVKFTSGFGMRMHPIKKTEMMHNGIDFAAPLGTDVYATANGIVVKTGFNKNGSGNYISIKHDDIYTSFYSQLDKILVNENQEVKAGEIIGKVGSSGMSTGPHLHYEVRKNSEAVDPEDYFPMD